MKKSLAVLGLVLALFGALVRGQSPPGDRSVPVAQPVMTAPSHILAPDELIEIKVFQEPDLTTSTRIPNDGRINFPLIGDVAVAGKSVQQATRMIQERLGARFLVNPQVSIAVTEPAKRLFTVLGQVQRPGTYRFPDRQSLDLMQVIGIAGGYTRLADPAKITVKRRVSGKETVFRLDGKRLATDQKSSPFMVADGDLISIGERLF
ncbi:MAG: polysaccharide biosynthesis/export family protein [Chthoniobacteraceae bacterium]